MTSASAEVTLTADEHAIYDRQLRIWGHEAQSRLRHSSVLLVGLRGAAVETAKNLVLTGIGALTIYDNTPLTALDLSANFFASAEQIGTARSDASVENIRALNPNVTVTVTHDDPTAVTDAVAYFTQFNAVILTQQSLHTLTIIEKLISAIPARTATPLDSASTSASTTTTTSTTTATTIRRPSIFYIVTYGFSSIILQNLFIHEYIHTHIYLDKQTDIMKEDKSLRILYYRNISEILLSDNLYNIYTKFGKRSIDNNAFKTFLNILMLLYYQRDHQEQLPVSNQWNMFQQYSEELLKRQTLNNSNNTKQNVLNATVMDEQTFHQIIQLSSVDLSPISAIIGGIFAQDILKVLSGKDEPFKNLVIYNADMSTAIVKDIT